MIYSRYRKNYKNFVPISLTSIFLLFASVDVLVSYDISLKSIIVSDVFQESRGLLQ